MHRRKRNPPRAVWLLATILLSLVLTLTAATGVASAEPPTWVLFVTGYSQEQSSWCWAATDAAILNYHYPAELRVSQCEVVNAGLMRNYCCDRPWDCNEGCGRCDYWACNSARVFNTFGFYYTCSESGTLSYASCVSEIYPGNRPFYASRNAHAYTVAGYSDAGYDLPTRALYVHDPANNSWSWWDYTDFSTGWQGTLYGIAPR